mmetsp:Transcript_24331/g.21268  ORF Transcript_24331/g.21268 Transcript_24331/m.21268 type:complete len:130 (+) Transcript_24331:80-469(+)
MAAEAKKEEPKKEDAKKDGTSEGTIIVIKDDDDFDAKLKQYKDKLIILDFGASWCGPCKQLDPIIKEKAKEFPKAVFFKIDVDECEETAEKYEIQNMPTIIFVKNEKQADKQVGLGKKEDIHNKIKALY